MKTIVHHNMSTMNSPDYNR